MKKNLLAASLALALGTMAGTASAALTVNEGGIGNINILPYYSVQDGNNTMLTITNTDTENGKIVKVRFRAAEWSDDALDFQVFLSPADVWTGTFGMVDGQLKIVTSDNSCTLPLNISGQTFATTRVEGNSVDRLKEGYVEIFDVADIRPYVVTGSNGVGAYTTKWLEANAANNTALSGAPGQGNHATDTNPLFTATKHINGVAPCTATLLNGLVEDSTRGVGMANNTGNTPIQFAQTDADFANISNHKYQRSWMTPPTGGLTSSATIIAVNDSKAFTVPAVAIGGITYSPVVGAPSRSVNQDFGVVQYFRQGNDLIYGATGVGTAVGVGSSLGDLTADRLFWPVNTAAAVAAQISGNRDLRQGAQYPIYQFDLPDVSTPFWVPNGTVTQGTEVATRHLAEDWRDVIADLLRKPDGVISDYVIDPSVNATTDIVLSQPVRRYYYAYQEVTSGTNFNRTIQGKNWLVTGQTNTTYEPLSPTSNTIEIGCATFYDREENTPSDPGSIVVSPQEPGQAQRCTLKGEVSVVSIKYDSAGAVTGSLGARLTNTNWEFSENYLSGWLEMGLAVKGTITPYAGNPAGCTIPSTAGDNAGSTWTCLAPNTIKFNQAGDTLNGGVLLRKATEDREQANLPVAGFTAINVYNAGVGAAGTNYGITLPLRYEQAVVQ